MSEPTKDRSYCDVGEHFNCGGVTNDESDPEPCMCNCHEEETDR